MNAQSSTPNPPFRNRVAEWIRCLTPFAVAAGLLVAGIHRLRPVLRESATLHRELGDRITRVQQDERCLRDADEDQLADRFEVLCQAFAGDPSTVGTWLDAATAIARELGWNLQFEITDVVTHPAADREVLRIPIRLSLRATGASGERRGLQDLLRFGHWILQDARRADVTGLTIAADLHGILTATLDLELWIIPPAS